MSYDEDTDERRRARRKDKPWKNRSNRKTNYDDW